jgi:hypothetical protein
VEATTQSEGAWRVAGLKARCGTLKRVLGSRNWPSRPRREEMSERDVPPPQLPLATTLYSPSVFTNTSTASARPS